MMSGYDDRLIGTQGQYSAIGLTFNLYLYFLFLLTHKTNLASDVVQNPLQNQ